MIVNLVLGDIGDLDAKLLVMESRRAELKNAEFAATLDFRVKNYDMYKLKNRGTKQAPKFGLLSWSCGLLKENFLY